MENKKIRSIEDLQSNIRKSIDIKVFLKDNISNKKGIENKDVDKDWSVSKAPISFKWIRGVETPISHIFTKEDFEFSKNTVIVLKEYLKNEAILNLIKKTKYLQLYIQFIDNQITEEEYDEEINSNEHEYFIDLKGLSSDYDVEALKLVLNSLPKKLSPDEISEIFGIQLEDIYEKFIPTLN